MKNALLIHAVEEQRVGLWLLSRSSLVDMSIIKVYVLLQNYSQNSVMTRTVFKRITERCSPTSTKYKIQEKSIMKPDGKRVLGKEES
ncbi:hypothetical protein CEXT_425501 [Caerostris extrusa]|uniref:Uncharacterized protein n=1 Tax=Caerostris extrusa TaxID=172846 RepID=A0AAV4TZX3_CAEEX|nr:hypothetical protein CEXT_425501 [Caerostris extrusa]